MSDEQHQIMIILCLATEIEHILDTRGATGTSLSDKVKSFDQYDDHASDDEDGGYNYRQYKRALLYGHYNELRHIAHVRNQFMHVEGYTIPVFIDFERKCRNIIKDLSTDHKKVCVNSGLFTSLWHSLSTSFFSLLFIRNIFGYLKGIVVFFAIWTFVDVIFRLEMSYMNTLFLGLFSIPVIFTTMFYLYKALLKSITLLVKLSRYILFVLMAYIIARLWVYEPMDLPYKIEVLYYLGAALGVFYLLVGIVFLAKKGFRKIIRRWKVSTKERYLDKGEVTQKVQSATKDITPYPSH